MARLLVFLLLSLVAAPGQAQVQVFLPDTPLVTAPGAERPVQLRAATLAISPAGSQAEATLELVLHNPNGRDLEGQLSFPLQAGQDVTGFALDIDGVMHDAVPVEKQRGREVFEAIERRQVDPALLERTAGNQFRLRIFPIPAGGERRVRLQLVQALDRVDGRLQLRLPLQFARELATLPLRVAGAVPQAGPDAGAISFKAEGGDAVAALSKAQLRHPGGLVLRWPLDGLAPVQVQQHGDARYFVAELAVPGEATARALPRRIGLLWDASGSAAKRDQGLDFALLDRYFTAVGNAEVRLQLLRDRATAPVAFVVRDGDWTTLKAALREVVDDGASHLGGWAAEAGTQEFLLFSDGLANYGAGPMPTLRTGQRLFAVNSAGANADSPRLQAAAEARGGRLVELAAASELERAARELLHDAPRIIALDGAGTRELVAQSRHARDGVLRIAGELVAARATVQVTVEQGGRVHAFPLVVDAAAARPGRFLAQVWAGYRLRELQAEPLLNRTRIRELGRTHGIATAETSLIVLETLEDYVRYDILPPEGLREAFLARRSEAATSEAQQRRGHLENVLAEFAERQAWWNTDFRGKRAGKVDEDGEPVQPEWRGEAQDERPVAMAPPAPVAPGEPSPARLEAPPAGPADAASENFASASAAAVGDDAREDERSSLDTIVVTGTRLGDEDRADLEQRRRGTGDASEGSRAVIALQPWEPQSEVARRLRAAPADQVYALYLDERAVHADSPAFYLDVADILLQKGQRDLALRVLSNLAELQIENRQLLRVLGYRLMQAGAAAEALPVFERVLAIAGEEPQSHRDLGLAHEALDQPQQAVDALAEVVLRPWDGRFGGIAMIALAEINAIAARSRGRVDLSALDPALRRNLPLALRTVLTWDSDNTDMDLWVTQPDGERSYYSNRDTTAGGRMSEDFTGGYGPEEYGIRRALPGKYRVEVDFYGESQQLVSGAVTVQVWLSTGFGTRGQRDERITVRLEQRDDALLVGEFEVR